MLMVTVGGDVIRSRVEALRRYLKVSDPSTSMQKSDAGIATKLRSLLICHASGLKLVSNFIHVLNGAWDIKVHRFISQTGPNNIYDKAHEYFVPFLM